MFAISKISRLVKHVLFGAAAFALVVFLISALSNDSAFAHLDADDSNVESVESKQEGFLGIACKFKSWEEIKEDVAGIDTSS